MRSGEILDSIFTMKRFGEYLLRTKTLCQIETSGAMGACDPMTTSSTEVATFTRKVPAGTWPVDVLLANEEESGDVRVALARVRFGLNERGTEEANAREPVRFELAVLEDQDPLLLSASAVVGYSVDSGTGCFVDRHTWLTGRALQPDLEAHQTSTWSWAQSSCETCVAFSTGYGDGTYASYFGIDTNGEPVCLVTDFQVLELDDLPSHVTGSTARPRRMEAERLAKALLKELAAKPRHEELEEKKERLIGLAESGGASTLATLLPALAGASGRRADFLTELVKALVDAPGAHDVLADSALELDAHVLATILDSRSVDAPPLSARLAGSLEARCSDARAGLEVRAAILDALTRGGTPASSTATPTPTPTSTFARLAVSTADAVLADPDSPGAARAARAVAHAYVSAKNPPPRALVERMRSLVDVAVFPRGALTVVRALFRHARDEAVMLLDDPKLRVLAGIAIVDVAEDAGATRDHAATIPADLHARALAALVEGAGDSALPHDLRDEAAARIPNLTQRCDVLLNMGIDGVREAAWRLKEAHDAAASEPPIRAAVIAALALLASGADSAQVRSSAASWQYALERERTTKRPASSPRAG